MCYSCGIYLCIYLVSFSQRNERNLEWLEHLAVNIIAVLVLDRFADFIGDEVCSL